MNKTLITISKWFNILSNVAFPLFVLGKVWYVIVAAIILMIGSGWMHYEEEIKGDRSTKSIMLDWLGMYALSFAVLASITNLWVLLLFIPLPFLKDQIRDYIKIGIIVLITVFISQSWLALLLFAIAYGIRQWTHGTKFESVGHGTFHIIAASAFGNI